MAKRTRYPAEIRERAVRMVHEVEGEHPSSWGAICSVAEKVGCSPESLRKWMKQADVDSGQRDGLSTAEPERIRELERENRELKRANEILRKASAYFARRSSTADRSDDVVHRRAPW